MTFDDVNDASL